MSIRNIILILLALILISFPLLYAGLRDASQFVFGGFLINPLDGNSYLAKMYQGWRGEWRFTLPYTADPGDGAHLFLFYLFLGHIARLLNAPLIVVFHVVRLASALVMFLSLYRYYSACLHDRRQRNLAFTLSVLGAGLGWLALAFGAFTSDFWVAEAYPFLSAYATPHFAMGLALLIWLLTNPISESEAAENHPTQKIVVIFEILAALALAIISPFGIVIALLVIGLLLLWQVWPSIMGHRWSEFINNLLSQGRRFWLILLVGGLVLSYDLWVVRTDSLLAGWNAQNQTPSPPIWDLLIAFSPALILAIPGAWLARKSTAPMQRELLVWAISGLILLIIPFGLQRRFMMGLFVPVAGLAVLGVERLAAGNHRRSMYLTGALLCLAIPTILITLLSSIHGAQLHDRAIYLYSSEKKAFDWVEQNTPSDSLILASPETGLLIPSHTGRRVIYGHPFETVNAEKSKKEVITFFENCLSNRALALKYLDNSGVDYVFFGPRESRPLCLSDRKPIYATDEIIIYQMLANQ